MPTMRCTYKWPVGENCDGGKGCRWEADGWVTLAKKLFGTCMQRKFPTKNLHFSKTTQIGPWTPGNVTQGILYGVLSVPLKARVREGKSTASKELASGDVFLKLKPSKSMVLSSLSVISQWNINWSEAQSTEWSAEVCPAKVCQEYWTPWRNVQRGRLCYATCAITFHTMLKLWISDSDICFIVAPVYFWNFFSTLILWLLNRRAISQWQPNFKIRETAFASDIIFGIFQ